MYSTCMDSEKTAPVTNTCRSFPHVIETVETLSRIHVCRWAMSIIFYTSYVRNTNVDTDIDMSQGNNNSRL